MALGVLSECYNNNQDHTSLLLNLERENWGKTTSLSLAKQADNKNFIAHSGVQNLLTEIWSGKLSDENNYWLVRRLTRHSQNFCGTLRSFTALFRTFAALLELSH